MENFLKVERAGFCFLVSYTAVVDRLFAVSLIGSCICLSMRVGQMHLFLGRERFAPLCFIATKYE